MVNDTEVPLYSEQPTISPPGRKTLVKGERKLWLNSDEHWVAWYAAKTTKKKGGSKKARGRLYDLFTKSMIQRFGWHPYEEDVPALGTPLDIDSDGGIDEEERERRLVISLGIRKVCQFNWVTNALTDILARESASISALRLAIP
jgi:hypothetical protein